MRFADSRLNADERKALELLERELEAQREDEYRALKRERYGSPVEPFVQTVCLVCGYLLIPNSAGFLVHIDSNGCSTPTVHIEEVPR